MSLTIPTARALAENFTGGAPFEPANDAAPLSVFRVMVKAGAQVRLSFEVLSPSKVTAQQDHECLCEPGEQVVVYTQAEWERIRFQPRRLSAMELQLRTAGTDNLVVRSL